MEHASYLLQMLLTLLAMNGVAPDAADPWRGWMTFKQYARVIDDVPDPGVSVQLLRDRGRAASLVFLRQVLEEDGDDDDWLEPVGGVVMEFTYPAGVPAEHEDFSHLMLQRPRVTRVYWQEA